MDKRTIAIHWNKSKAAEIVEKTVTSFCMSKDNYDVILFKTSSMPDWVEQRVINYGCRAIDFPGTVDTAAKQKNFILSYFEQNSFRGFLHIVEDVVVLDKDPLDYILKIENTMDVFDYSIFFSTVTDPCNYLFKKFNPRLTLDVDDDALKSRFNLSDRISFTSHSNTCWTIYDFNKNATAQKFDERFSIGMFMIIEYLARRRSTRQQGQLYYMNQYLSISDEVGTYHAQTIDEDKIDPTKMQEEDQVFKAMKIDYAPDNNIDTTLDDFYQKIQQKIVQKTER